VPHSIEEVPVTGGGDIFVSEEPVPFNAVETRSRKKKQDEADKKIDINVHPRTLLYCTIR
jgi:hypothetical protein